ncbi:MAG TPA: phosphoribosyltransferase family protein [Bacillus sp. (in: firmicutes)]|nr:phosphoribosyltransferase family protein [Bacillus sp. (in: firmicutes)]
MKYIELSIKDTEEASAKLAQKIGQDFKPDVVIFVAKGSLIIGDTISKYFGVPLVEIYAVRDGNKFKDLVSPILKIIPKSIKVYLRKKEFESGVHSKNAERRVYLNQGFEKLERAQNILVVDDSVDTGNTVKQVHGYIINKFGKKSVRLASLNYFEESIQIFRVDYSLYKDTILIGPWSKDSKYYSDFVKRYEEWEKN